jgi:hypothetical protein
MIIIVFRLKIQFVASPNPPQIYRISRPASPLHGRGGVLLYLVDSFKTRLLKISSINKTMKTALILLTQSD